MAIIRRLLNAHNGWVVASRSTWVKQYSSQWLEQVGSTERDQDTIIRPTGQRGQFISNTHLAQLSVVEQ